MSDPWDWISDDDVADWLNIGSTLINIRNQHRSSQSQEAWARFNKQADAMKLAHYIDQQKREADFDRRAATLHTRRNLEAGFEQSILRSEQEAIRQKIALHDATAEPDLMRAYKLRSAEIDLQRAQLAAQASTRGFRRALSDQSMSAAHTAHTMRQLSLTAAMQRTDVGEVQEALTLGARQTMVDAGLRAVAAEREELQLTFGTRLRQRQRAFREEVGEARVGAAARGVTGSIEQTAEAMAAQRAGEDIGLLVRQTATQEALLGRRGAELGLEATRITADRALGAAARAVQRAQLAEGRETATAARDVSLARAGLERETLRVEEHVLAPAQRVRLDRASDVAHHDWSRGVFEARLKRVAAGIEGARYGLAERRSVTTGGESYLAADRARQEARTADISATLARWSLEHVPALPDYEGARFRSAVGSLLGLGASLIDDDDD